MISRSIMIYLLIMSATMAVAPQDPGHDETLRKQADLFVAAFNQKDAVAARKLFSDSLKKELGEKTLVDVFDWHLDQKGKIREISKYVIVDDSAWFTLAAERGRWELRMTTSRDNLIS